jgi:hypothetical protein
LKEAEVIFSERYGLYKKMPILADVADLQSVDEGPCRRFLISKYRESAKILYLFTDD